MISEALAAVVDVLTSWRRYLAWYPAAVAAVHSDGTLDVIPDEPTMRGAGHRVRYISGTAAGYGLPRVGDRVLLFFAGGDPAQPTAIGTDATAVEALALAAPTKAALDALAQAMATHVHPTAALGPPSVSGTVVTVADIESDFKGRAP